LLLVVVARQAPEQLMLMTALHVAGGLLLNSWLKPQL
jgi:hypothetical protein